MLSSLNFMLADNLRARHVRSEGVIYRRTSNPVRQKFTIAVLAAIVESGGRFQAIGPMGRIWQSKHIRWWMTAGIQPRGSLDGAIADYVFWDAGEVVFQGGMCLAGHRPVFAFVVAGKRLSACFDQAYFLTCPVAGR